MELLFVLLKNGRHSAEDVAASVIAAIVFSIVVGLISRIKSKKKDMDEVSKDDKNNNSDW